MAEIAKSPLDVSSKILKNNVGDTELEKTYPDVVDDQPGEDYDDEDEGYDDEDEGYEDEDEGYDVEGEEADTGNQDSNEEGTLDGDSPPSNATDNNKDSTENPTERSGEGGNASSAAKETEKEQTSDKNPIETNGEGGNASSAAKETEKDQTSDNNYNPAAANNAKTTAPPPSQPQTREPQGQQQPQLKEQQPMESDPTPEPPKRPQNRRKQRPKARRPPPQQKEIGSPPRTQRQPQENKASDAPQNTQLLPQQQLEAQAIPSGVVAPLNGNEANVYAPNTQIKKESVLPPRELEKQPQVNNASDAPPKKQPQTQPETERQAKSTPSVQEKALCPSSAVPLPTPEDDAATLHRAFKGRGCDVGKVVQILAQRDSTHRNQIAQLYKKNYDEELSDRISSEFSRIGLLGDLNEQVGVDLTVNPTGSFSLFCSDIKRAITLWLLNESERDATIVWQSLQVTSLDKAAVTEVICSRTPSQLRSLKQAYFTKYGSRLLEDISASTFRFNGYHKELLIACLDDKTTRDEGTNVDPKMAEEDARQLYKDGEKIWGTNEKTFVEIFTKRNRPHLAAVDVAYQKLYGHSLEEAVKKETSGSFEAGLATLLRCAKNSAKYFAEVLYNSMRGLGTSNAILSRTVVTKAGSIEMEDIKKEYSAAYKISLLDAIHKDTSGHYRTFLVNLVK
ncbi:hypothetical protein AAC387_Pa02g5060 [Persea americana]